MHPPLPEAPPKPKNDIPGNQLLTSAPVHKSTLWPGAGRMSGNLFEDRNWLLLPNYPNKDNEIKTKGKPKNTTSVTSPKPPIKEEELKTNDKEKCRWGPDCPFCKSQKKEEENKPQQQKTSPKVQKQQTKRPNTLNLNMIKARQQWEAEMERLNEKYNFDCFSSSELDSESDEGEQYHYEHDYERLI